MTRKITVAKKGRRKDNKRAKVREHTRRLPRRRRSRRSVKAPKILPINSSTIGDFAEYLEEKYSAQVDFAIEKAKTRLNRIGKPLIKEKIAEEAVSVLIGMGIAIKYPNLAKFSILVFLG